jgi:hypothetical protein
MSERKHPTPAHGGGSANGPAAVLGAASLLQDGVDRVIDAGRAGVASVREFGADIGLRNADDISKAARGAAKLSWDWVRANPLKSAAIAGAAAAWLLLRARR